MSDMSVRSSHIVGKQFLLEQQKLVLQKEIEILGQSKDKKLISPEEYEVQLQILEQQITNIDKDIEAEKARVQAEIQNLDGWGMDKAQDTTQQSHLIMFPVYQKQVENAKKQIEQIEQQARYAKATGDEESALKYETQIELWKGQMQEALEKLKPEEKEKLEQLDSKFGLQ